MNIFVTYKCPEKSAMHLDDVRVNKMILETAQMLCVAIRQYKGVGQAKQLGLKLYKQTHINHGCNIWARTNRSNFLWLVDHYEALYLEKYYRTKVAHSTGLKLPAEDFRQLANLFPDGKRTKFVNHARNLSLGLDFTHLPVHRAYREYLSARWVKDSKPAMCKIYVKGST